MAVSKYIVRTRKNRIFEYYLDSVDKVLDTYIKEVLGFNKRFKISEESWINATNSIKRTSFKVALINGLCRTPNDNIVDIIIEQFAYPYEVPKDDFIYELSNDLTHFTIKKYTGISELAQIPDNCGGLPVTKIASEAFSNCENLIEVVIPENISEIEAHIFDSCTSLRAIYFGGTQEQWNEIIKEGIPTSINIYYNSNHAHIIGAWRSNGDGTHTGCCQNEYPEGTASCVYEETANCIYDDWVVETPATCSQKGLKTQTCKVCGGQITEAIEELDHTAGEIEIENEIDATCSNSGSYEEVTYCSVCGKELERLIIITDDRLPHVPSAATRENIIAADCKNDGSYDEVVYCSVCGDELSRKTIMVEALGHDYYPAEELTVGTCKTEGQTIYRCSHDYSHYYVESKLNTNNHEGEIITVDAREPTCDDYGYTGDKYYSCCNELESRGELIEPSACIPGDIIRYYVVEPTCSTTGSYHEKTYCKVCGTLMSTSELLTAPIDPNAHIDDNDDGHCDLCDEILLYIDDTGTCGEQLTYTLYSDGTLRIQGEGNMYDYSSNGDTRSPFSCAGITQVLVEHGVSSIGNYAFYECSDLTVINLPSSLTSVGHDAFYCCTNLASVDLSNTKLTNIREYTFYGCTSLASIAFPESLTEIDGRGAFQNCLSLISVILPESVTYIARNAFTGCSNLVSINIPNACTGIGMSAFVNCTSLISIELPESLQDLYLGTAIFASCTNLSSVIIKNGLTAIPEYAFSGCTSLTSIEIPMSVTKICSGAFQNCSSLASIDLSSLAITSIGEYAFQKCSNLVSVKLPSSLTYIGMYTFESCTNLASVDLSNTKLTDTNGYIFRYCSNLTSVSLPKSLTNIGIYAFSSCVSLASIALPNGLTSIGKYAFSYCTNLTTVNYGGTEEQWNTLISSMGTNNEPLTTATVNYQYNI